MKTLLIWLHRAVLSPLPEPGCARVTVRDWARDLDRPTYLRRGLSIDGVGSPVVGRR